MSEHHEFFEQLRRGEQPASHSLHQLLHRIPPDKEHATAQVARLLRHAADEIGELVETICNITRWHGQEEICSLLEPKQVSLLHQLKSIAFEPKSAD